MRRNPRWISVVIADDDPDAVTLLSEMLDGEPDIGVVATASDADEAIKVTASAEPDVLIADWMMPGGGGSAAARQLLSILPDLKIIALTGGDATEASYDMLNAGAVGFLQKGCSKAELVEAIHSVIRH